MKLAEAAEISGLHIDTLRRSCRAGELKHRRVSHDHSGILIEHQDPVNYLKRREIYLSEYEPMPRMIPSKRKAAPVTRDQVNAAVEEYLKRGGTINRIKPPEPAEYHPANVPTEIIDDIES